ncbi:MAG TPA: GntR family transcriptional regulator [Bradyrhizobium sp.]
MTSPRPYRSAEELVYDHLRTAILRGQFLPEAVINQEEIAKTLKVSRIPVRDALRRLHSVGLVHILPNKRTVVPSFTSHEIFEIFEMRAVLEGLAARNAVPNLTDSDFHDLTDMAKVMRSIDNLDMYLERHEAFHDLIADRARLPRLRREVAQLREIVGPYIRINGTAHQSAELEQDRHDSLLVVFKTQNPAAAEKALASHVRHAGKQLVDAVESLTFTERSQSEPEKRRVSGAGRNRT